jgi:hypothetical protein
LGTGTVYPDQELRRLFTVRFARRLDQQGYVRFRYWRIYGELGLGGAQGAVWLYGENLTVHFAAELLAQHKVVYERDQQRIKKSPSRGCSRRSSGPRGCCSGS